MSDPHGDQPIRLAGAPLEEASAVLILVHGRGDSADGIMGLARGIDRDDLAVLAPQARGNSWYPNSFLAPLPDNEPWLGSALATLRRCVDAAISAGLPPEKVALAGFSQGACLALESSARFREPFAFVAGFSGGLIGTSEGDDPNSSLVGAGGRYSDKRFDYASERVPARVILRCSDVDPHIPWERVQKTAVVFSEIGSSVDVRAKPGGAHQIEREGYEAFLSGVRAM